MNTNFLNRYFANFCADEKENSLGVLTKRFLEVAATFPDGVLELNKVADQLGVSKRRMYDITNVLEGVNLLQKQNKNVVLWKYVLRQLF